MGWRTDNYGADNWIVARTEQKISCSEYRDSFVSCDLFNQMESLPNANYNAVEYSTVHVCVCRMSPRIFAWYTVCPVSYVVTVRKVIIRSLCRLYIVQHINRQMNHIDKYSILHKGRRSIRWTRNFCRKKNCNDFCWQGKWRSIVPPYSSFFAKLLTSGMYL